MSLRLLVFHPALAPYRLDMFNALATRCHLRVVSLHQDLLSQSFDQRRLRAALTADHGYLTRGFTVGKRTIRFGFHEEIRRFVPDVVVTQEFSPSTLGVLANRAFRGQSFAHVVWT